MARLTVTFASTVGSSVGRRFLLVPVLAIVLSFWAVAISMNQASASVAGVSTGCGWFLTSSPNRQVYNELNSITGVAANDIWAVGSSGDGNFGEETLVEHWNGINWRMMSSPNEGDRLNTLYGVSAVSASDIWAVGSRNGSIGGISLSQILHWDGSSWSVVPGPDPGTWTNELYAVTAVAPDDVWAVGTTRTLGGIYRTLVVHWDGAAWRVIPSADAAGEDELNAVVALSPDNIWAVGTIGAHGGAATTLTEHWDGMQWSIVPSPNAGLLHNFLLGVSASSPNNVWAVGFTCPDNNGCGSFYNRHTLAMRWDGTQWSLVNLPDLASQDDLLLTTLALSPDDVWAMGSVKYKNDGQPLAMHWDGASWSVVPSEDPQSVAPEFRSVLGFPGGDLWAVGAYHFGGNPVFRTFTERFAGPCGTVTPTGTTPTSIPTRTPTPHSTAIATHTPTQISTVQAPSPTLTAVPTNLPTSTATDQPTNTPTVCAVAFFDVSSSDFFYPGVIHLACAGAISGYSDGTFRPYNDATRGQLSKIVVLAEGWPIDTTGAPHFSDVQVGSPFYDYVQTAYNHSIISGYADGTFRSVANVTRGQLSKIVVTAEGWPIDLHGAPHFSDVQAGSAFYGYVETAYYRGIISGYSDGTFRPGNNAIRGQIAKIVYGAVTGR